MFEEIKKCLKEYEEIDKKYHIWADKANNDIFAYFDLHLAEAIMKDFWCQDKGVKVAKIILAMQER